MSLVSLYSLLTWLWSKLRSLSAGSAITVALIGAAAVIAKSLIDLTIALISHRSERLKCASEERKLKWTLLANAITEQWKHDVATKTTEPEPSLPSLIEAVFQEQDQADIKPKDLNHRFKEVERITRSADSHQPAKGPTKPLPFASSDRRLGGRHR